MALAMTEAVHKARSELSKLTGLEIASTIGAIRKDEGWLVTIEAVEKHSIPDGMDVLATYETILDADDNLLEFKRTRMRKRIDTESGEE